MTTDNTSSVEIDYEYEDYNSSKRSKMTSKVWEDMQRIQTSDGSKVLCKHCGKLLQDHCGTSHLKRHLMICPKRPKPLDIVTQDSVMPSVCIRGTSSAKESGIKTKLVVRPMKVDPESQVTIFSQDSNIPVPTAIPCIENAPSPMRELHQKTSSNMMLCTVESPQNEGELTLDDVEMKAFYASLDAEPVMSPSQDTLAITELSDCAPCEETNKALKTLQDLLSKDFSVLVLPGQCGSLKSTIDYLSKLPSDDAISSEMRLLVLEVSREFTRWSCDYNDACRKIESASTNILKADKLEEGLEANKNQFKEVLSLETELTNQLASLEQKKKELEEQINAIKANISVFQSAKNTAIKRKREVFEEGKTLKAQRDELREQVPHLREEWEVAKKVQADIRAEWSKLGEKFNKSFNGENCEYLDDDGMAIQTCQPENHI